MKAGETANAVQAGESEGEGEGVRVDGLAREQWC